MATSQLLAPRRRFGYALVAVLALLLMGTEFGRQAEAVRARVLSYDCDGYWHLLRVADLHRGGSWDNEVNARGNAPYGERLHWTHAMDLVLWGGATIGGVFTDFDSALYWWGALVGPAFYASSLLVTVLFGRFLVGPRHEVLLGLVFVSSLALVPGVYSANRADHHCLVAFAFVVYYCLFVALLARPQSPPGRTTETRG